MFGNTRKTIILTKYLTISIVMAGCAVISLLTEYLNSFISKLLHFKTLEILRIIYGSGINNGEKLLWFFALLLFISGIALLYSTLEYRFGKIFKRYFWGAFGLTFVLSTLIAIPDVSKELKRGIEFFFSYGTENGIMISAFTLFIMALVIGLIAFLVARRQPQNDS